MSCNCDTDSNGTKVCPVCTCTPPMSEREKQWLEFSERVAKHLREYTVPQYGDVGEDEITNYTDKTCVEQVCKYGKRFGSQSREGQQELDFVKMAHYTQCAWEKYLNKPKQMPDVEQGIPGRMVLVGTEDDMIIAESGKYVLDSILTDIGGDKFHFWITKE